MKDEKKLGPKSVKNVIATLRKILVCAFELEYMPAMPFLSRLSVPQSEWDYRGPEESDLEEIALEWGSCTSGRGGACRRAALERSDGTTCGAHFIKALDGDSVANPVGFERK